MFVVVVMVILFMIDDKVVFFCCLFCGCMDVYLVCWESKVGKVGYLFVCVNEWCVGICEKLWVKCVDCYYWLLILLIDQIFYDYFVGCYIVGVYFLLEDDSCYFLVVDFDDVEWCSDVWVFVQFCCDFGVLVVLEVLCFGEGVYVWVFFFLRVVVCDVC